ncbi:MAG: helix-turn-helix domain-containing protein [Bacteroidota bacterium]
MKTSLVINALIVFGTFQAFFIAFILLKSNRTLFKSLFAALLVVEGIILMERLLVETQIIRDLPHLLGIAYPISFLKPPLILLMTSSIVVQNFRLLHKHLWHLSGFAFIGLLNIPFYFLSGSEKLATVETFMNQIPSYSSFMFYFYLSFFAYIGIYVYLSIKKLRIYHLQISNNDLVNWLYKVLLGYSLFLILHLIYHLIQPIGKYNFALFNQLSMLAMTFIIQSIAYKIFDKSTIFKNKTQILSNTSDRLEYKNIIINKLVNDKAYLDDSLSLLSFSNSVNISSSIVSEVINQTFNCSFKRLINKYRLAEAKSIIENKKDDKIKLIDVAFDSGFNNKVSFYRAFKELEGISPSSYLEKVKKHKK